MHRLSVRSVFCLIVAIVALVIALPWAGPASAQSAAPSLAACSPNDITTGGGWILPGGRGKRTFGFEAGVGPNAPVPGRLVFFNKPVDERLRGLITAYTPNPTNIRVMSGTAQVNEETVLFVLRVTDNNGSGTDLFSLSYATSDGPRDATGALGGGNIEIHPMCF